MKLRSYNEELLIAAALMTDLFNDVIIERRKHGLERDYSKAIKVEDILQKNIEVPCVIGDRSAVLKSLENHEGAIKLPLFILENQSLKVDQARIADLHYDLLYQPDQCFYQLDVDDPRYKPYDLRKRRPVPVTIQYKLTMITKYKEDLDQMITNWIVHFRPDVYVKWYHPKFRPLKYTIESQIIGGNSVSYKPPEDSGSKVYQYTGDTSFTFKTWLFTGMDYECDQPDDTKMGIIKYFNWFPTEINTTDVSGTTDYPVIGDIGVNPAGFYAVPNSMEFIDETGEDLSGISNGKYFANNIGGFPAEQYVTRPKVDIKNVDVDLFTKDTFENRPDWKIYQDYCTCDLVSNERFGVKIVYFQGGYPLTAWLRQNNTEPSGDFLFQHFCSEGNTKLRPEIGYYEQNQLEDFGMCFTESLKVNIDYDFNNKILTISGMNENDRYSCLMYSKICSLSGIEQSLQINNKPIYNENNKIKVHFTRKFTNEFEKISKYFDYLEGVELLNTTNAEKPGWKHNQTPVKFILETTQEIKKLKQFKSYIEAKWDQLEIYPCDEQGNRLNDAPKDAKYKFYKLGCENDLIYNEQVSAYVQTHKTEKMYSQINTLLIDDKNINILLDRKDFTIDNKEYTLLVNQQLYFVLSDDGIYDWGIVVIPRFAAGFYPIFKSTIKNGQLIYGLGMNGNVSPILDRTVIEQDEKKSQN